MPLLPGAGALQVASVSGGRGSQGCRLDASHALHAVMPVGEQFTELRRAAAAVLSSGGADPSDKAAVALFVCEVADDCHSAVRLLDEAVAHSER